MKDIRSEVQGTVLGSRVDNTSERMFSGADAFDQRRKIVIFTQSAIRLPTAPQRSTNLIDHGHQKMHIMTRINLLYPSDFDLHD